ncbi:MAG: hypothetical protein IPG25_14425 [Proteobacteria bacterium]|nr:hypothetical protein [Pseudomonadota bacterium]
MEIARGRAARRDGERGVPDGAGLPSVFYALASGGGTGSASALKQDAYRRGQG